MGGKGTGGEEPVHVFFAKTDKLGLKFGKVRCRSPERVKTGSSVSQETVVPDQLVYPVLEGCHLFFSTTDGTAR